MKISLWNVTSSCTHVVHIHSTYRLFWQCRLFLQTYSSPPSLNFNVVWYASTLTDYSMVPRTDHADRCSCTIGCCQISCDFFHILYVCVLWLLCGVWIWKIDFDWQIFQILICSKFEKNQNTMLDTLDQHSNWIRIPQYNKNIQFLHVRHTVLG